MDGRRWISLSQDEIAPAVHPGDATWVVESPSIYDIPSHVRSAYDEKKGILTVEFKYLETEPLEALTVSEFITAKVGTRSKRIFAILVDIHRLSREKRKLGEVFEGYVVNLTSARKENREIASRAMHVKREDLFGARLFSEHSR